nr:MAG TPA: dUTPase [Caudoviricetes sp.]
MKIKVLRLNKSIQLPKVISKGDWIDLRLSSEAALKAPYAETLKRKKNDDDVDRVRTVIFDYQLLPLGVAVQLPKGFEAVVVPRSSSFKKYGIIQANSQGIIDCTYCGNKDEWKLPVLPTRNITIPADERICQFRIQLSQKATVWQKIKWLFSNSIKIVEVDSLSNDNRDGFGSTGNK